MNLKIGPYVLSITSKIVFPLIVAVFVLAYYVQVRNMGFKPLLFANPLLYLCGILAVYVIVREGMSLSKINGGESARPPIGKKILNFISSGGKATGFTILIILFLVAFEYAGFVLTSFAFLLFAMLFLGVRNIASLAVIPILVVGFVYFLFAWWLKVRDGRFSSPVCSRI